MATPADAQQQQLIFAPNVQANVSLVTIKFYSSAFAGAAAGILGLENWLGFALFAVSTLLTSACIYTVNCGGRPAKYMPGGVMELVNPGTDNAFTFVLVWTLFYGASRSTTPRNLALIVPFLPVGIVHGEFWFQPHTTSSSFPSFLVPVFSVPCSCPCPLPLPLPSTSSPFWEF
jgi:hypothetical protein